MIDLISYAYNQGGQYVAGEWKKLELHELVTKLAGRLRRDAWKQRNSDMRSQGPGHATPRLPETEEPSYEDYVPGFLD